MNLPGLVNWKIKVEKHLGSNCQIARIISVNKTNYNIQCESGDLIGELSGKLLFSSESEVELPVAGDFVRIDVFDELAIINEVLPRFSFLKRKTPGKKIDYQSIAANIDYALIVQAIDSDFNLRRLERYLTMIYDSEIIPIVLLTKTDLISKEEELEKISSIKNIYNALDIYTLSNVSKKGVEEVINILECDKTYCLLGSSGVGKSTLINNITGNDSIATGEVRISDKKGKHTTTKRELINLENGSILIDTPGMRELANFNVNDGLSETFIEIDDLINKCKFTDCNHISDSGCALIDAVDNGKVSEERYNSFIKLKKEADYYESSYLEKRRKDKEFGKMVKSVMKGKKFLKKK